MTNEDVNARLGEALYRFMEYLKAPEPKERERASEHQDQTDADVLEEPNA